MTTNRRLQWSTVLVAGLVVAAALSWLVARPDPISAGSQAGLTAPTYLTYVENDGTGEHTIELLWWSSNEWTTRLLDSPATPEHEGREVWYRFGSQAILDPVFGSELLTNLTTADRPAVPNEWLVPRDYAGDPDWTDAGVDSSGNRRWQHVDDVGVTAVHIVDPATGVVVRGEQVIDGETRVLFDVTGQAPLEGDRATPPPLPEVDIVTDMGSAEPEPTTQAGD